MDNMLPAAPADLSGQGNAKARLLEAVARAEAEQKAQLRLALARAEQPETTWGETLAGTGRVAVSGLAEMGRQVNAGAATVEMAGRAALDASGAGDALGIDAWNDANYGPMRAMLEDRAAEADASAAAADRADRRSGANGWVQQRTEELGASLGAMAPLLVAGPGAAAARATAGLGGAALPRMSQIVDRAASKLPSWAGGGSSPAARAALEINVASGLQSGTQSFQDTYEVARRNGLSDPLLRASLDSVANAIAETGFGGMQGATGALSFLRKIPAGRKIESFLVDTFGEGAAQGMTGMAQYASSRLAQGESVTADGLLEAGINSAVLGMAMPAAVQGGHKAASVAMDATSAASDAIGKRMDMRRALSEIQNAPVEQQAALDAAMEPGRAPSVPDTRPELGSMRAAMLAQAQDNPIVQAGITPVEQTSTQLDAPAAPVDPAAYDPAANAQDAVVAPDRADFDAFLAEQKQTPDQFRQAVEQTGDLVEQPADEQGVRVGQSAIEGKGIIVQGGASKGMPLATAFDAQGRRTPTGRYMNHAAKPNSVLVQEADGRIVVVPKQDLKAGEEVTVDYRQARREMDKKASAKATQKPAKGTKAAPPAPAQDKGDWVAFDAHETLGVPRAAMPQIATADRPVLMDWLKSQGIRSNTETVEPGTLKPTQAEYAPSKVQRAVAEVAKSRAAGEQPRPIIVSSDGYVIDGHHQWLAAKAAGEKIGVIRVGVPAAQAIQTIKRFPGVRTSGGAEGPATVRSSAASPGVKTGTPSSVTPAVKIEKPGAMASTPGKSDVAAVGTDVPAAGSKLASLSASSDNSMPTGDSDQAPADPAAASEAVAGDRTIIDVPGGQDMPAAYEVRELDSLIASGDYSTGSVTKNDEYPAELQPRDYAPGNTEDVKVQSMAQGQKPGYYINTDPSASNGPPTVTANGTVLNGNGRAMSLQLSSSRGDMGWYRRELDRLASVFGLDPQSYAGMRQPVLVRVVKVEPTSDAAKRFARQGNVSSTQAQSPARTAASLGNLVDQGVLDTIDLEDEATTFSEAVSGAAGRDFRQALASALPAQEVPRYLNEQTGGLTEAGKELVRDLLLTKQLPVELIERMREDRKAMLRSLEQAIPQMMRLDGVVPESRVNEHLTEALEWISKHPEVTLPTQLVDSVDASGKATQQDLTGRDDGLSPEARMLAEWLLINAQKGKSSKPGLVSLIRGLENRSSPILGDTRSGGQIAADALGVPMAPGAEFGMKASGKQTGASMSFRKDDDNSVETSSLAKSLQEGMPAASAVTFIPDGPFGYRVESRGKPVVKVRVALPQDFERLNAEERRRAAEAGREPEIMDAGSLNGWADGSTIYLTPGGATKYTYNHELVHVLANLGVLTRAEVEKLARLAHKILTPNAVSGINVAYRGASSGRLTEELAAHVIEAMAEKKSRPSAVDRVLAWLRDMAAMLRLTTQSDYGLAKDVASGRILDKRDIKSDVGNDDAKQSRRIDAPGQQSLFGEQIPAPEPVAKAKA